MIRAARAGERGLIRQGFTHDALVHEALIRAHRTNQGFELREVRSVAMQPEECARRIELPARQLDDVRPRHCAHRRIARGALEKEGDFPEHRTAAYGGDNLRLDVLDLLLGEAHLLAKEGFGFLAALDGGLEHFEAAAGRDDLEDALDDHVHVVSACVALDHE